MTLDRIEVLVKGVFPLPSSPNDEKTRPHVESETFGRTPLCGHLCPVSHPLPSSPSPLGGGSGLPSSRGGRDGTSSIGYASQPRHPNFRLQNKYRRFRKCLCKIRLGVVCLLDFRLDETNHTVTPGSRGESGEGTGRGHRQ